MFPPLSPRNHRPHQVDPFESLGRGSPLGLGAGKPGLVHQTHLADADGPSPLGWAGLTPGPQAALGAGAHARGIDPVRLGKLARGAVPLGSASRAHFHGKPVACKRRYNAQRVAFTAAASLRGVWPGPAPRESQTPQPFACPFFVLQGVQASVRLLTRLLPPLALGTICSTSSGTFVLWQYAHVRPHFSNRYCLTSKPASVPC